MKSARRIAHALCVLVVSVVAIVSLSSALGAADDPVVDRPLVQGVIAMGTVGLDQVVLPLALDQQQLVVIDLEPASVTVVEVDQLFQGIESHHNGNRLYNSSMIRLAAA